MINLSGIDGRISIQLYILNINFGKYRNMCSEVGGYGQSVHWRCSVLLFNDWLVFHRKDLCDARPKPKMSSYFQMKCTDSDILLYAKLSVPADQVLPDPCCQWEPIWNTQLVRWSVQTQIYPPFETVSDRRSSLHWSMSSMRAHLKWTWN